MFIKDNRFYQFADIIKVPWSNKELDIEFASFRDKTLPGSEEKWTLKIKGNKNEKVSAEMLASMYDASLDQFKPHAWDKPGIWPQFAQIYNWQSIQNFSSVHSNQKWMHVEFKQFEKIYDQLRFNLYNEGYFGTNIRLRGQATVAEARDAAAPMMQESEVSANKKESLTGAVADSTTSASKNHKKILNNEGINIRKNFNETAFFFPELRTDKDGNIEFSFTTPDALP